MTEILIDVDFGHPPDRVWRALTDRAVLSEWFMRTDLEPYEGRRFRLMPDGLLGLAGPLEGELVEVAAPRRLVMLWRGEQLHSRVTWELVPLPEGCRLRMSHTGFIGVKGSLRRKELQRTYDRMLGDRLPRVLDRLASGRAVARDPMPARAAPAAPLVAVPPLGSEPDPGPAPDVGPGGDGASGARIAGRLRALPHRRRGQVLAVGAAVLLAVITAATISGLNVPSLTPPLGADPGPWPTLPPGGAGPSAAVPPPAPASPGAPGAPPGGPGVAPPVPAPATDRPGAPVPPGPDAAGPPPAGPTGDLQGPPAGPASGPPAGPPAGPAAGFAAAYRTVSSTGSGFTGELTVTNTGTRPAGGWRVLVTLPDGAGVTTVRLASAAQSGSTVTFTPRGSGRVPAGRSVTLQFDVRGDGASAPTGCLVGDDPCSGLSG